jgi:oligoribonuclease NrnB/cAMP/cGMP phosphodiesterase (DHH superfamily)
MHITGHVVKKPFAVGSKSEREAIMLETEKGEYMLRRQGGNPYHDEELEKLVGKKIEVEGKITGYTLLISNWTEKK